jgi:hypothetical protein
MSTIHRDAQGLAYSSDEYLGRPLEDIGERTEDDTRPDAASDPLAGIKDQRTDAARLPAPPPGSVAEAQLRLRQYIQDHPEERILPASDDWR